MLRFFAKGLRTLHEVERDERGFTLIELLIVVIIIGILAAIAIPTLLSTRTRAYEAAAKSDARNAAAAAIDCAADHDGEYTDCTLLELTTNYDFHQTDNVTTNVTAGDPDLWTAEAQHDSGGAAFEFSTATGKVTEVP